MDSAVKSLPTKLIRSATTKAFLTADGCWTTDVQQAHHFVGFSDVPAAIEKFKLHDVQLYYSFDDRTTTPWDFVQALDSRPTFPAHSRQRKHT